MLGGALCWYAHVNGDRIVAALRRPAIVALIWFAALWTFIHAFTRLPPLAQRLDFANYYDSALALRQGLDPYTTNLTAIGNRIGLETGPLIHASETPAFLLCFEALTRFPPAIAFWIWISLNLVGLAIAIYLLLVRRPALDASTAWLLGAMTLVFYPVSFNFIWAQSQVMVLMLLVLAMQALEDEREGAAGLLVAIAGLLRAFPFLLLGYFALRRKWKALEFAIVGTIAGALITAALVGFARCFSFLNGAVWVSNHAWMNFPFAISLAPFVSRMFWVLFGSASGLAADWLRGAAIVAADAIVLGATIRATLVGVGRRDDNYRIYSLWIVTSLLLSPIAWHHYLVLLVIPFVQIAVAACQQRSSRRALWMAAGSYLLACVSVTITYRLLARPTAFQLTFPSLSAPLLETGFFTLLMGYIAAYWFAVDLRSDDQAVEPHDLTERASSKLSVTGA
ncbi:MAG: glycosyltransferase family 87 protein [Candidatus Binatus sp.]|uniref:glycosyltransferase family 87 protein n=1 Tax=Candidatus Binatus sp. TaxID=2811406 RepID=UPI003C73111F